MAPEMLGDAHHPAFAAMMRQYVRIHESTPHWQARQRVAIVCIVRRPLWTRLLIGLWAVWFTAALIEAPGIRMCAMHSGAAATGSAHASADMPMQSHMQHEHSPAPSKDPAGCCTCLGLCCVLPTLLPKEAAPTIVAHYAAIAPRRIESTVVAPYLERPYQRPFANGPPGIV